MSISEDLAEHRTSVLPAAVGDGGEAHLAAKAPPGSMADWAQMLLVDHGILRFGYLNAHRLGDKAWRTAQPAPHQIGRFARRGVRTIVNLRGPRACGSYRLEQRACERHGIALVNYKMRSRAAPTRAEVLGARDLFARLEGPVLFHCKSGADRVGLISTLYLIAVDGVPVDVARRQLAYRYGHVRNADTGVLDCFFDCYLDANARSPIEFFEWVETVYDPEQVAAAFVSNRWANVLVNRMLRRE